MNDVLLTLVADRYRTEMSRAVLTGIQAAARRGGLARAVRPVFWPEDGGLSLDALLRGTETVVLVLDAGQRAAGDALLAAWEAAGTGRLESSRVLPVILTGAAAEDEWAERLVRPGISLPPVLIRPDRDIHLGHGGAVLLSEEVQVALKGRANTMTPRAPVWGVARNAASDDARVPGLAVGVSV